MLIEAQARLVAGVDDAGRGPLAGPVVAAAVILDPERPSEGLRDSKALTAAARSRLAAEIKARALAWGIAAAEVAEIDALNILRATFLAMRRAVESLPTEPSEAWIDGNRCPELRCATRAIVNGDARVAAIAAASILAKTARDTLLDALDLAHPVFGFAHNKGYATHDHLAALNRYGPCAAHRRTFAPVMQPSLDF